MGHFGWDSREAAENSFRSFPAGGFFGKKLP